MTVEIIQALLASGRAFEVRPDGTVAVSAATQDRAQTGNAARCRRAREAKKLASTTMSGHVETMSKPCRAMSGHVETSPSPRPLPSPSPTPPSSPTPTPPPPPVTPMREELSLDLPESTTKPAWRPTEAQLTVGGWFCRKPSTPWTEKELRAWAALLKPLGKGVVSPPADDMALLGAYYTASLPEASDYRRTSVLILLNNWAGEVDRARKFGGRRQSDGGTVFGFG